MTVAALEAYPLIGGLPGELRRRVVKTGRPFRAEVGSVLFDLDGPCSGFTLILGGLVDVSRPNADGRELLLYHLSRGDTCVLTLGCLLGEGTYPARAVVRETVSGVQLPRTLFREMLDGSPAFRDAMLGMFSRRMTRLVGLLEATAFGVMAIDAKRLILDFVEKPADPPTIPGKPGRSLASMGIYIFNARFLYRELERDMADPHSSHDFGKDIIPKLVKQGQAVAHPFEFSCVGARIGEAPYWRDVGTIDAYWDANIDLTATDPLLNLYDTNWPIWTYQPQLPPAKFVHNQDDRRGVAVESLVSGGCIISGAVFRSVLFSSVRVHSYSAVSWSVLLPGVQVGRHARLTRVVVDRDCVVPDGMVIGEDAAADAEHFYRTESGITLVTREMLRRL